MYTYICIHTNIYIKYVHTYTSTGTLYPQVRPMPKKSRSWQSYKTHAHADITPQSLPLALQAAS